MVSFWRNSRHGAGGLGCLLSLLLFADEILDGMRTQARLAPSLHDDVIDRRLTEQADSLLPGKPPQFRITRGGHPSRITIETEFGDKVDLPLFKHPFVLRPKAGEPL